MRGSVLAAAFVAAATGTAIGQDVCGQIDILDETLNGGAVGNSTVEQVSGSAIGSEQLIVAWNGADVVGVAVSVDGGPFTNIFFIGDANGTRTATLPSGTTIVLRRTFGVPAGNTGSIDFSCNPGSQPQPPTTPPPSPPSEEEQTRAILDRLLDSDETAEMRDRKDFLSGLSKGSYAFAYPPPTSQEEHDRRWKHLQERAAELFQADREILKLLQTADGAAQAALTARYQREVVQLGAELTYEGRVLMKSPFHGSAQQNFAPSPGADVSAAPAAVRALDQLRTLGASADLPSPIPGWAFNVSVESDLIARTFGALEGQTRVGTVTLSGGTQLDPLTALGFGVTLDSARATVNTPFTTLDSASVGADIAVLRTLSPGLTAFLDAGYEFGHHRATVAGVGSSFATHTFKLGGIVEGRIVQGPFVIAPSLEVSLLHRHRPSFTDGAGVIILGSETSKLKAAVGATVSRDVLLSESGLVVTPFLGANLAVSSAIVSPAITAPAFPVDPIKLELQAGAKVAWETGATFNLRTSLGLSATTTTFGLNAGLTVPIH